MSDQAKRDRAKSDRAKSDRAKRGVMMEVRRFERRLPHRPEKVWRALTESRELARWFPAAIEGEREKGAAVRFLFARGEEPNVTGEITECDPPRVLAFTMGEEHLRWELSPIPEGCLLVLTTEVAGAANDTTTACVSRLAA